MGHGQPMRSGASMTDRSAIALAGPPGGFDLLRWFAVLSLVCVVVSGSGAAFFLSRFLTGHMLQRDAEVSAEFLDSIVQAERTWSYFSDPASAASREPLESFFNHVSKLPGVVRANVFATDGTVLWSSNPAMTGRRFADNHKLEAALRGQIVVESGTVSKEEHFALSNEVGARRFVEAYLPVFDEARRRVVGVVEIYRLPDALFRAIDEGVRLIWISAGLATLLLYAALLGIVVRARCVMALQQQRLLESETLAAIGAVASAVAHGIRNPLASIRSSAELAALEEPEGARRCLSDIQRETDRLERWVRDLLMQAKGEPVAPGAVDVNLLLAESARSFAAAAARQGVDVVVQAQPVPPARAEAGALGQAIDNLVANAIEAMPEGGGLRLSTALLPGGRQVQITVADTGGGLPAALRARSARFYSSKARGTGLGLVLTRRILARQGGTLTLDSVAGQGTTAMIRLPVTTEAGARA
jgi:signal transduction histidine kinase